MAKYVTNDGQVFNDQYKAVIHQQILDFKHNGGFDIVGNPYMYGRIETIDCKGGEAE